MVSALVWVLAGVLLYTVVATAASTRGLLPNAVRVSGPITTIHTQRGKAFLNWLAGPKRFWRAWANVGVGITLVIMVGAFATVIVSAVQIFEQPSSTLITQPQDALAIPGVNSFLPLSVAPEIIFGLLIGLIVHEGGHGLLCRVEDIEISSMGLALFTLIPLGAFVEPNEEQQLKAERGPQTRMFAAGVTNNFVLTVVAFALLFGPVVGSIAVAPGVAVGGALPGTPAANAGIESGDVITGAAGQNVSNESELATALDDASRSVEVTLDDGNTTTVRRSVVVTAATRGGPTGLGTNESNSTTIAAVNGTPVATEQGFESAIENHTVATLRTTNGSTTTAPMGAYATRMTPNGPLANATDQGGEPVVITRFAGERVTNTTALSDMLADTQPGDTVRVEAFVDDERTTATVTLGENPRNGAGLLGVNDLQQGTSGLVVDDFGIDSYPAGAYLDMLGGGSGGSSPLVGIYTALILPLAGIALPQLGYNFPGFVGMNIDFYTVTGPLSFLGDGVFTVANLLFWTAWINLNLGFFNCIPAFPLDGGHILRTSTEAVVSRLPVGGRRALTGAVTTAVSITMLAALVVMIFGPSLLSG